MLSKIENAIIIKASPTNQVTTSKIYILLTGSHANEWSLNTLLTLKPVKLGQIALLNQI